MSETQQTTAKRLAEIISARLDLGSGEWISAVEAAQIIAAEIDTLTAQLAEAAQWLRNGVVKIERLEKERDEARAERDEYGNTIDRMTVNEIRLKAEVERLRPAAEAWEAGESFTILIRQMGMSAAHAKPERFETAKAEYEAAAARARMSQDEAREIVDWGTVPADVVNRIRYQMGVK